VRILHEAQESAAALEVRVKELDARLSDAEHARKEADEAAKQSAAELDDLFIVLGDLEEKREGDKKRLKELGVEISDDEDDGDDDDGDGEEEGEE
jgi:septal ring factor EnvC (AmiA/AmiB activator)